MPALPMAGGKVSTTRQLDLGTTWGLSRGNFIGIVIGSAGGEVYQSLLRAERALFGLVRDEGERRRLKTRWWIRVDFSATPEGPRHLADVWRAAADPLEPRVQHLLNLKEGLPEPIIPGIYFRVDSRAINHETAEVIRNWCQGLTSSVAPTYPLAIILDLAGLPSERAKSVAAYVRGSLLEGGCAISIPIEVMCLAVWHGADDGAVRRGGVWANIIAEDSDAPPGASLNAWLDDAFAEAAQSGTDLVHREEYGSVTGAARFLGKELGNNHGTVGTSRQVVEDLWRLTTAEPEHYSKLQPQFLRLVREYLPHRLRELIEAYALSPRDESRREGLVFAAQSDPLMDVWLDGLSRRWERMPDVLTLPAEPGEETPPANQLVLALLRRYNRGQDRDRIKPILEGLQGNLSSDMNAVILMTLGRMPDFDLSGGREEQLLLAVRAGAAAKILSDGGRLPERLMKLDTPEIWWALMALPPSAQRLADILALDPARRAVFGLCSPEEWAAIRDQSGLEQQIIACRRNRPLIFNHQP